MVFPYKLARKPLRSPVFDVTDDAPDTIRENRSGSAAVEKMRLNQQTVQRLLDCSTSDELARMVGILLGEYGATHWIYAFEESGPVPQRQFLGDYPASWVNHYQAMGYPEVDPTVLHAVDHGTPFLWPDHRKLPHDAKALLLPENKVFVEAHEFGLNGGITVPLHRSVAWGLMSLAFDNYRTSVEAQARIEELFFLAHQVHEVGLRLLLKPQALPDLSLTELECLRWAASGLSTTEIAAKLKRKPRWVTDVFLTINRKMGAPNRQAAVALALARRIIQI